MMKFLPNSGKSIVMKFEPVYLPVANLDIIGIDNALTGYPNKAKRLFQELERKIIDL